MLADPYPVSSMFLVARRGMVLFHPCSIWVHRTKPQYGADVISLSHGGTERGVANVVE